MAIYEYIECKDPDFPVKHHLNVRNANSGLLYLHWHENIELLFGMEGDAVVHCDTRKYHMKKNDLIVVNSNHFHSIYTDTDCKYYCIIVDKRIFDETNLPIEDVLISDFICDKEIQELFLSIINELREEKPYYKTAVKSKIITLFSLLYRNYSVNEENADVTDSRVEIVKKSISFMRHNYQRKISIEEICESIGFSKYYVCHVFKKITGRSLVDYLNFLRCSHAYNLISTGKHNSCEAARLSGFSNDSYFGRTYKKYIGTTPSKAKPKTQK